MKLSQALREVARLHAEDPGNPMFDKGICYAVYLHSGDRNLLDVFEELGYSYWEYVDGLDFWGDWTVRPTMCLLLAEYLEMDGR